MIVVKIQGGIGNQLFQFALALSLKKRNPKSKVSIDISFYNHQDVSITQRKFYLNAFSISEFSVGAGNNRRLSNLFLKIKSFMIPIKKSNIITEKTKNYDLDIFLSMDPSYLIGYFQSYKYFEAINTDLREQLVLKDHLTKESESYKSLILSKPASISIHVRRGDYLAKYETIYHQLTIDYYKKAIEFIKAKLGNLSLSIFIFSDDLDWCKENIVLQEETVYIENTNKPDFEDLILMSYCKHNIIANSSYSWWSAWLNLNNNKVIVAPNQWYTQQEPDFNNSIYPPTWNVL